MHRATGEDRSLLYNCPVYSVCRCARGVGVERTHCLPSLNQLKTVGWHIYLRLKSGRFFADLDISHLKFSVERDQLFQHRAFFFQDVDDGFTLWTWKEQYGRGVNAYAFCSSMLVCLNESLQHLSPPAVFSVILGSRPERPKTNYFPRMTYF